MQQQEQEAGAKVSKMNVTQLSVHENAARTGVGTEDGEHHQRDSHKGLHGGFNVRPLRPVPGE